MFGFLLDIFWKIILCYLGAAVRWVFLRKKKTFKQISDDINVNASIGFAIIVLIVLWFTYPLLLLS